MEGGKSKAEPNRRRLGVKLKSGPKVISKPKRPLNAYLTFMKEFRVQYKETHPDNKLVTDVSKAGGDIWKSMTTVQKAQYKEKADKGKEDYKRDMEAYNRNKEDMRKENYTRYMEASNTKAGKGSGEVSHCRLPDEDQEEGSSEVMRDLIDEESEEGSGEEDESDD